MAAFNPYATLAAPILVAPDRAPKGAKPSRPRRGWWRKRRHG